MGYIGSVTLLLICLAFIMGTGSHLTKWAFVLVGVWWVGWAQPAFRTLPSNPHNARPEGNLLTQGFKELRGVAKDLKGDLHLTRYLGSFFVMSMASQTIMLMATSFGIKVQLSTAELIVATLLVQIVAIPGALSVAAAKSAMSKLWAAAFWHGAPSACTPTGLHPQRRFYFAAGVIGFMMGGTQSLNRSTYSKLIPKRKTTPRTSAFTKCWRKVALSLACLDGATSKG